jgi:hypothetical protein
MSRNPALFSSGGDLSDETENERDETNMETDVNTSSPPSPSHFSLTVSSPSNIDSVSPRALSTNRTPLTWNPNQYKDRTPYMSPGFSMTPLIIEGNTEKGEGIQPDSAIKNKVIYRYWSNFPSIFTYYLLFYFVGWLVS